MTMRSVAASEIKYGIVEQATFGTICGDSTTYTSATGGIWLQCDHFNIQNDLQVRESAVANGGRYMQTGDVSVDQNEGMPEFTITMPEIRDNYTDLFLAGWFQNVTEGDLDTDHVIKTFALPVPGSAQQPDFTDSAGHFYTVTKYMPNASESHSVPDAICKSLTFSHEPGGMLALSAEMVARGEVTQTADPSATWERDTSKGKQFATIVRHTIDFGGGVATAVSLNGGWEVALTQDVVKQGADSGDFENYGLINRGGNFTIRINADAHATSAAAAAAAGTLISVNLGFGTTTVADAGTTHGDLDIAFTGILDNDPEHSNEGILAGVLTGKLIGTDSASPVTIIQSNAIDRAW